MNNFCVKLGPGLKDSTAHPYTKTSLEHPPVPYKLMLLWLNLGKSKTDFIHCKLALGYSRKKNQKKKKENGDFIFTAGEIVICIFLPSSL